MTNVLVAAPGERTRDRVGYRAGHYPRSLVTERQPCRAAHQAAPAKATPEGIAPMSAEDEIELQNQMLDPTVWALIFQAESADSTARDVPYWGIIPFDRLNDPDGTKFYVRARVSASMIADVEVTKDGGGISIGSVRMLARDEGQYRLTIYSALAVLPERGRDDFGETHELSSRAGIREPH